MFKSMLFFLFFSFCFAQPVENTLDQDDKNIPGAGADLMDLSSPSSENNAKEILNQLSAVLIRNLPQTFDLIADMKEEMGDMKEKLAETENKLKETEEKLAEMGDMKEEMGDMKEDISRNEEQMASIITSMSEEREQQEFQIESLSSQIDSLGARGHWCATRTQDDWRTPGTITYERITYSDSNMNISALPLDINTGINTQHCLKC